MSAARVLIVEDNSENLELMDYLLRVFGYTVLSAPDGEAGIEMARRERPDLILMDLQMPTMTGFEAVKRIRALDDLRPTPVIAVTALAMVGDRERVLAAGFDGYLSKPINPQTFVLDLEAYLPASARAVRSDCGQP